MLWFIAGLGVGAVAGAVAARVRRGGGGFPPSERELIAYADQLDAVERLWKPANVGVGYSIDYGSGEVDVTLRVPNCGEDVVFHLATPNVRRVKRRIEDVLTITRELPPSLGGAQQIGGDQ